MTKPDYKQTAQLILSSFVVTSQINFDPFLRDVFIALMSTELERAHRAGSNNGISGEEGYHNGVLFGLERAAEVIDHAATMPFGDIPDVDIFRTTATALRRIVAQRRAAHAAAVPELPRADIPAAWHLPLDASPTEGTVAD